VNTPDTTGAAESWSALVDLDALSRWMDGQGLGAGPIHSVVSLTGGTQNIMLRFSRGGSQYVLRRPPRHPRANSNDTMRREMRVLAALGKTDVPHARLIAACPDADVLGTSFYLMERVEGFNPTVGLPPLHAGDPRIRHRMGLALIDGLIRLAGVDHHAVGLAELGKTEGFLERQVSRWTRQLAGYREYEGWPGPGGIPGVARVADWLEGHRPAGFRPGIMHGDYHLANVMYRNEGPDLAAIVDWELATLGDPLLDLGLVLTTWPRADDPTSMKIEPWEGFPSTAQLAAHYAAHSDRDLTSLGWYEVLACFKLGILLEGTFARACAGKADRRVGERFHARTRALFERALRLASGDQ
jgi:aminoglycoside phosphotransferase (APT) family kinase protein